MMMEKALLHTDFDGFYTATCSDGHAIVVHEPCGSMVLHEPSLRLSYVTRAATMHLKVCQEVNGVGAHAAVD